MTSRNSSQRKGMCKVIPTQTKTPLSTPKQSSKKQQNTEKRTQSKILVGRKRETTQSSEQKNPTNSNASGRLEDSQQFTATFFSLCCLQAIFDNFISNRIIDGLTIYNSIYLD